MLMFWPSSLKPAEGVGRVLEADASRGPSRCAARGWTHDDDDTTRRPWRQLQAHPRLPDGDDERFTGYGVMGMPFASGHYLALRDMVASSVGPAYRAIWHRDPDRDAGPSTRPARPS